MPFTPAWWLPGPHLQTVWGRLTRPRRAVSFRREVLATPDDDDLILDHLDGTRDGVRFVLLHGLEGSSYSIYIQGILAALARDGFRATVMNFRSCARDPRDAKTPILNRRPRLYHSGETTDLDFVLKTLASREPRATFLAFGASLGGNVLLKWLGERPDQRLVAAAATLSVPYDLGRGARHLETPLGRLYVAAFLRTLRMKADSVAARFPEAAARVDLRRAHRATTFHQFDDAATAPLHGFAGADDYYTRSSSIGFIDRITVPTLCLSAEDDPFLAPGVLRTLRERASSAVEIRTTARGGHIGFIGGAAPWNARYWGEETIVDWLRSHSVVRSPLSVVRDGVAV